MSPSGATILNTLTSPYPGSQTSVPVAPQQGDEVDALDDAVMLARPVALDQVDAPRVGLVQHGVIQDQNAGTQDYLGLRLAPEGVGIGFEAMQQPREGVVGWGAWL